MEAVEFELDTGPCFVEYAAEKRGYTVTVGYVVWARQSASPMRGLTRIELDKVGQNERKKMGIASCWTKCCLIMCSFCRETGVLIYIYIYSNYICVCVYNSSYICVCIYIYILVIYIYIYSIYIYVCVCMCIYYNINHIKVNNICMSEFVDMMSAPMANIPDKIQRGPARLCGVDLAKFLMGRHQVVSSFRLVENLKFNICTVYKYTCI